MVRLRPLRPAFRPPRPGAVEAPSARSALPALSVLVVLAVVSALAVAAPRASAEPLVAAGPSERFAHFSPEQGLSQAVVQAMAQDEQGFLWLATQDGLNRFDGYGFTVFRNDPADPASLPDNTIFCLAAGRGGVLWVGSADRGLARLDLRTLRFTRFAFDPARPGSLPAGPVGAIHEDRKGRLWVATQPNGLARLDPGSESFHLFPGGAGSAAGLGARPIGSILETRDGALWLGTRGEGLLHFDPEKGSVVARYASDPSSPRSLAGTGVLSLLEARSGALWVGTISGISRFEPGTGDFTSWRPDPADPWAFPARQARQMSEDAQGRIWVATEAGLVRIDATGGKCATFRSSRDDPASLPNDRIFSVLVDRSGILWVGMDGAGLAALDLSPTGFRTYRHEPTRAGGLTSRVVRGLWEGRDGTLWVGLAGGGLNALDLATGRVREWRATPNAGKGPSSDDVFGIVEDDRGALWIATLGGGLDRFDPATGTFRRFTAAGPGAPSADPGNFLRVLAKGRDGAIWIGAVGTGLSRLDPATGSLTSYRNDPANRASLSSDVVRAVHVGPTGTVWAAGDLGINRFDPASGSFTRFLSDPSRPETAGIARVYGLYEDPAGILWAGTARGLVRLDPRSGAASRFRQRDGLPNEAVYSILPDAAGSLWLSTNRGLSRVTPGKDGGLDAIRNFDSLDGLQGDEFNGGSFCRGPSGTLWFGGINGLTGFRPEEIRDDPFVPPVSITAFSRLGRPLPPADGIARGTVVLGPDEGFFTVEFAALAFRAAAKNSYAWKLEGLDPAWTVGGTRRRADYTAVPPGEYVFRVKAANKDGLWNHDGASLKIVVLPPWWRTRSALASWAVLVALGIAGFHAWQKRRILAGERERSRLVEAELRAKAAEAQARAVQAENERQSSELEEARALQLSLLPRELPRVPGLSVAALTRTATEVGGDTYDAVLAADGALAVIVGDATGHGLKAGTVVSVVKGLFRGNPFPESLPSFLDRCGRVLRDLHLGRLHMALAAAVVRGRDVTLCSAGIPPAWLFRAATGEVEEILLPGAPLGALIEGTRGEASIRLEEGDCLLLATDGLAESPGPSGDPWGYPLAREAFRRVAQAARDRALPLEAAAEAIAEAEAAWRGETPRGDDMTLVLMRCERPV